jgi:RecB family exonuclease
VITARSTRLFRTPDLRAFRRSLISLSLDGAPLDARDRLVVVPTRAAGEHLRRSIERHALARSRAAVLPEFVTPRDLVPRLAERLPDAEAALLTDAEREVLLGVACGAARAAGVEPPFRLRPGLTAEILRFYDELRLNGKDTGDFERLAVGELEPAADDDRGAARLLRQTRFLVAAFREFEARAAATGALDVHGLRQRVLATPAPRPWRHAVVAVADAARDRHGLPAVHWDLLARVPGLERLDVVVTEGVLAGAFHDRIQALLPGIEEQSWAPDAGTGTATDAAGEGPVVVMPASGEMAHTPRDREEEVALFARRVRRLAREGALTSLDRAALVVQQPLPYVYVARETLRAAAVPAQTLDAVPLAAEPYAAALDLVLSAVAADFARAPSVAMLRSPHLRFARGDGDDAIGGFDCAALDRALSEARYLGGREALDAAVARWRDARGGSGSLALAAGVALQEAVTALALLASDAPRAAHLACLLSFLTAHERLPGPDDPARTRQLRARAAVLGTLEALRAAAARFDPRPVPFDEVVALVRRWLEGQTFALRSGGGGVHVVDADSARFGDFDVVHLAGLVDAEWPPRPRRSIFYSSALLKDLGWPSEADLLQGARDAFLDLLRLPAREVLLSRFTLEDDALVAPSPFLEDAARAGLATTAATDDAVRVFDHEALALAPVRLDVLDGDARAWGEWRRDAPPVDDPRFRGSTGPPLERAFAVSALERYLDCPFQYFAQRELRLDEPPDDEPGLSPRDRGTFLHAVFQAFFEAWDASGHGSITPGTIAVARDLFREVAAPRLETLPAADAALERARLFGSAIRVGIVDLVLGLETARPGDVRERWLEHTFDGEFLLGDRRVALRGVADRVDLLQGNRLRVIDYKTGSAPKSGRALQVPIYALCATQELEARDGQPWEVEEGAYLAFGARRPFTPVVKPGKAGATALDKARERALEVIDGIAGGRFPPRPSDPVLCTWCAYPSVCRKDYVGDE